MNNPNKAQAGNPDQLQLADVREASAVNDAVTAAELAPAIGQVVCIYERTGRQIIRTGAYDNGNVFSTGFAPEKLSEIFMPYDQ